MSGSVSGSYGGLVSASGGFTKSDQSSSVMESGEDITITFKVRKVII